jgi:hypothetical protein
MPALRRNVLRSRALPADSHKGRRVDKPLRATKRLPFKFAQTTLQDLHAFELCCGIGNDELFSSFAARQRKQPVALGGRPEDFSGARRDPRSPAVTSFLGGRKISQVDGKASRAKRTAVALAVFAERIAPGARSSALRKKGRLLRGALRVRRVVATWEDQTLSRVVHLVLDRMRGVLEADHLGHLQLDIGVDEIVIEHAAGLEEVAVLVEVHQRLAQ